MQDAVIVAYGRSAIGKAKKALRHTRPDELAGQVVKGLLGQVPDFDPAEIDDVVVGNAFPEAEQGMNLGRIVGQIAGLPESVPGQTVNRYCASGLQTIASAAFAIMCDQADAMIAGGVESMSLVPMMGNIQSPNPQLVATRPQAYTSMGLTAENVAASYGISRADQDAFALRSHQRAQAAQQSRRFVKQIVPVQARDVTSERDGVRVSTRRTFQLDEGIRPGLTVEALEKLRPVFKAGGSVTAGNASQMSDGAAFVLVMSGRKAAALHLTPVARFVSFAAAGVPAELMGIGPIQAIPKALDKAGVGLEDIELIELNEAFASQSLACIRELRLDPEIVNVNGGAIALGHPLGCSGAMLTVKLLEEMELRGNRLGLVSMCVGGGMGAAAVLERC